jgi:putative transposase
MVATVALPADNLDFAWDRPETADSLKKRLAPALMRNGCAHLLAWIGLSPRKFHDWRDRSGWTNEQNVLLPRDHCITPHEHQAIIDFVREYPLEGYRRLTFMMLNRDLVAVSPSTSYRVLKDAGLLQPWSAKPSKKGTGFVHPIEPHDH